MVCFLVLFSEYVLHIILNVRHGVLDVPLPTLQNVFWIPPIFSRYVHPHIMPVDPLSVELLSPHICAVPSLRDATVSDRPSVFLFFAIFGCFDALSDFWSASDRMFHVHQGKGHEVSHVHLAPTHCPFRPVFGPCPFVSQRIPDASSIVRSPLVFPSCVLIRAYHHSQCFRVVTSPQKYA